MGFLSLFSQYTYLSLCAQTSVGICCLILLSFPGCFPTYIFLITYRKKNITLRHGEISIYIKELFTVSESGMSSYFRKLLKLVLNVFTTQIKIKINTWSWIVLHFLKKEQSFVMWTIPFYAFITQTEQMLRARVWKNWFSVTLVTLVSIITPKFCSVHETWPVFISLSRILDQTHLYSICLYFCPSWVTEHLVDSLQGVQVPPELLWHASLLPQLQVLFS